jgi:hypothetical protein
VDEPGCEQEHEEGKYEDQVARLVGSRAAGDAGEYQAENGHADGEPDQQGRGGAPAGEHHRSEGCERAHDRKRRRPAGHEVTEGLPEVLEHRVRVSEPRSTLIESGLES